MGTGVTACTGGPGAQACPSGPGWKGCGGVPDPCGGCQQLAFFFMYTEPVDSYAPQPVYATNSTLGSMYWRPAMEATDSQYWPSRPIIGCADTTDSGNIFTVSAGYWFADLTAAVGATAGSLILKSVAAGLSAPPSILSGWTINTDTTGLQLQLLDVACDDEIVYCSSLPTSLTISGLAGQIGTTMPHNTILPIWNGVVTGTGGCYFGASNMRIQQSDGSYIAFTSLTVTRYNLELTLAPGVDLEFERVLVTPDPGGTPIGRWILRGWHPGILVDASWFAPNTIIGAP